VLRLWAQGYSIDEITAALAEGPTPLNRTGVWEICRDDGLDRLPTRGPSERPRPPGMRKRQPRVRVIRWPERPVIEETSYAGLLLLVPALVELDLPAAVGAARMPGTSEVPALASVLSLLALKAIGGRRVSHVDDVAVDAGLATFAGLESLPKATALGTGAPVPTVRAGDASNLGRARRRARTDRRRESAPCARAPGGDSVPPRLLLRGRPAARLPAPL